MNYSFLMSVYFKEKPEYLKFSIESMLNQTKKAKEIIIVEDGKLTKELEKVINSYIQNNPKLFNIIKLEKNVGLGLALNEGIKASKNELIARMDSDDICLPDRCEKQLNIFEQDNSYDIVGTNIGEFIDDENNIVSIRKVPEKNNDIYEFLKYRCPFNHQSVMIKKESVLKAGNYQDFFFNEDYDLWIRMALKKCKFYNIQEKLVLVRIGNDMFKRRGGLKYFESEKKIQDILLKYKIINNYIYIKNVTKRLIVQVLLPNRIRQVIFKKLARQKE